MLLRAPMRMVFTSPRRTVLYQTEDSSPISTLPMTCAPSATNTDGWRRGVAPWKARIPIRRPLRAGAAEVDDAGLEPEKRARRAVGDADPGAGTRRRGSVEVHRAVLRRPAEPARGMRPARTLDQHLDLVVHQRRADLPADPPLDGFCSRSSRSTFTSCGTGPHSVSLSAATVCGRAEKTKENWFS